MRSRARLLKIAAIDKKPPVTEAERTAPTIVGDASTTSAESGGDAGSSVPSQVATIPTVVVSQEELAKRAAANVEAFPKAAATQPNLLAQPAAATSRSRAPLLFVGVGVVVLLLIVGVGGFALMHFINRSAATSNTGNNKSRALSGNTATDPGAHEVTRYWLEVDTPDKSDAVRAGDSVTMASGQSFKFHFSPSESGYVYIIGPGDKNAPTTFLTAQPAPQSGLKTNEARSGLDFAFPADTNQKANFITLDKTPGTDEFVVVFATKPITEPAFFARSSEHQLTADELKQWQDFRALFKGNLAGSEVIKTGAKPFVSVKVPQTESEGAPVIFQVKIEHN
jgi:hypothetical protein